MQVGGKRQAIVEVVTGVTWHFDSVRKLITHRCYPPPYSYDTIVTHSSSRYRPSRHFSESYVPVLGQWTVALATDTLAPHENAHTPRLIASRLGRLAYTVTHGDADSGQPPFAADGKAVRGHTHRPGTTGGGGSWRRGRCGGRGDHHGKGLFGSGSGADRRLRTVSTRSRLPPGSSLLLVLTLDGPAHSDRPTLSTRSPLLPPRPLRQRRAAVCKRTPRSHLSPTDSRARARRKRTPLPVLSTTSPETPSARSVAAPTRSTGRDTRSAWSAASTAAGAGTRRASTCLRPGSPTRSWAMSGAASSARYARCAWSRVMT
jgi:hypothetical protein